MSSTIDSLTFQLGELHVQHATLDVQRAVLDTRLRELEKRINEITRTLITQPTERPTNEAFPTTRIPGTGDDSVQSAKSCNCNDSV